MFDDFMHNNFPDMNFNQAQQDAMLHSQNLAMEQTAQQTPSNKVQTKSSIDPPQLILFANLHNVAANIGLSIQTILEKILQIRKLR